MLVGELEREDPSIEESESQERLLWRESLRQSPVAEAMITGVLNHAYVLPLQRARTP